MPLFNIPVVVSNIVDSQISASADIDPLKLLFTSMGCWMRKITAQAIPTSTLTAVNFNDGETFDNVPTGTTQLHDPATSQSRIILRRAGIWVVVGHLAYQGVVATGGLRTAYLFKNGATTIIAPATYTTLANGAVGIMAVGLVATTVETDYVELGGYHDHGSDVNVGDYGAGTFFGAAWLGNNS